MFDKIVRPRLICNVIKNYKRMAAGISLILTCSLILCISGTSPLSANPPNVVLVFDSSRSMWGQIDGLNKVVILRNVFNKTFQRYDSRLKMSLVSYGHNKSIGCNDISTVEPMAVLNAKTYSKAISEIKPKGSTPIGASLKHAAKIISASKEPASIVLVSDGLDNCKANPCGIAQELKKSIPSLKIHVIAFDRAEREKLKALSCVAQFTGGKFSSATSEEELQVALANALDSTMLTTSATGLSAGKSDFGQPVAKGMQQSTTGTMQNSASQKLSMTAPDMASQQTQPGQLASAKSKQDVSSWNFSTEIAKTGIGTASNNPATTQSTEKPTQLAAQKADRGLSNNTKKTSGSLVPVSFSAKISESGRQIRTGLVWRIFEAKPTAKGKYNLVSSHRNAQPTAALPPGEYLVNAAYGRSHLTKKIKVASGKNNKEEFVLNTGGLRLNAVLSNGEPIPINNVKFTIYSDERDQFGKRSEILSSARPNLIIRLNAGIYHIVSHYGDANAEIGADVTVEPGKLTEATINHNAAKITFKLVFQPGGEALANTQWSVLSATGDVVKESAGALPTHILAAGKYTVLAKHDGQNYRRDFDVGPSEVKQIEVVIQ